MGEAQETVDVFKNKLTSWPILTIFDPNKSTKVHIDANVIGVGAVLVQKSNGQTNVVTYYSKQTTAD